MRRTTMLLGLTVGVFLAGASGGSLAEAQTGAEVTFTDHIRPIFERSCWNCHGEASQLSGLDLRSREAAVEGGTRGPGLVPGRADESRIYRVLAGLDDPPMPMAGDPLSDAELSAIRTWIDDGAHWDAAGATSADAALAALENTMLPDGARDYWAFRLPAKAAVPASKVYDHPVDRFLDAARRGAGVKAGPQADPLTRLRRAYLDLTGLPPTPGQVEEFLADTGRGAWERLIDRLLDSPHYGERWGRHWMDVARYADSTGFEQDYRRENAWRYRDYVINAFNQDKPYNQFLREQIAGDELDHVTDETRIATGFLRAGPRVDFREKDNPERRHDYLDDVLATLGRGVLGMTVHCARCHDHKFDPILQKDYYSLQASIFGYVEIDYPLLDRADAAEYRGKNAAIDAQQQPLRDEIAEIESPPPRAPAPGADQGGLPRERPAGGGEAGGRADRRRTVAGRPGAVDQSAPAAGRRGPVRGGGRPLEQADGGGGGPRGPSAAGAADGGNRHRRRLPVRPGRSRRRGHRVPRVPHPARRAGVVPLRGGGDRPTRRRPTTS